MRSITELSFYTFSQFNQGTIYKLLFASYAANQPIVDQHSKEWEIYDAEVYANLDKGIGKSGFVTCLENDLSNPIGFASWDPRGKPDYAVIGHNCILPKYQGNGYGRLQVQEILRRLNFLGIREVRVSTGADDFFLPARRMYESCGFEVDERSDDEQMVHYLMSLDNRKYE